MRPEVHRGEFGHRRADLPAAVPQIVGPSPREVPVLKSAGRRFESLHSK